MKDLAVKKKKTYKSQTRGGIFGRVVKPPLGMPMAHIGVADSLVTEGRSNKVRLCLEGRSSKVRLCLERRGEERETGGRQ